MAVTFDRIELEGRSLRENVGQKEEVSKNLNQAPSHCSPNPHEMRVISSVVRVLLQDFCRAEGSVVRVLCLAKLALLS